MKRVMKHLQLPSGLQSGLPVLIDDAWSIGQVVAVTELLQDLLHVINARYEGELYAYWQAQQITQLDGNVCNDDEGVPF